jgi:cytoskeletal protein CcmA (bactofilin family)
MSTAQSFGIAPPARGGIGKSVVMKGNLLSEEDLTIDGQVEGTIDIIEHRLTITENGTVRANVNARDIDIWGRLEGKVEAVDRVYIRKGANFIGDIHAGGIVIEEGGYMRGNIDLSRNPETATSNGANSTDSNHNPSKPEPIQQLSEAVLTS